MGDFQADRDPVADPVAGTASCEHTQAQLLGSALFGARSNGCVSGQKRERQSVCGRPRTARRCKTQLTSRDTRVPSSETITEPVKIAPMGVLKIA